MTCSDLRQSKKCQYHFNYEYKSSSLTWDPLDIEDLHKAGIKHTFCPYYAMKRRLKEADVVFMPYNYVIDHHIRKKLSPSNFEDSIIIFDEAHNVSKVAESAGSYDISHFDLILMAMEIDKLKKYRRIITPEK